MYDTAPAADNSTDRTSLAGAPGALNARYERPAPRSVKAKKYRELLKTKQLQSPIQLVQYLLGTIQLLRSLDSEARKQHNRDIATFYQYYDCNEFGDFNEAGEWIADAKNAEEFSYTLPLTPAHVDSAKTLLTKVALEYEYKAKNDVSVLDGELARMCEKLAEEEMERIFTDDLQARERLYLLLAGKSYRHHFWAGNPMEPNTVEIPVYENQSVDMPEHRVCGNAECGTPLGKDDAVCPKCLGDQVTKIGGGKTTKMQMSERSVQLAENQMYVPNPLAIQHDLSKTNINRSFLVERDAIPRSEAEFLYCQVFANKRDGLSEEMTILRELERSRLRTGQDHSQRDQAVVKSLFANDTEMVERERAWLEPWRCGNFVITEDHWYVTKKDGLIWCEDQNDLPENAKHVPRGSFIGDVFPTGTFVCVVDDEIVEINGSQVSDKWYKLIFGMRPSNADGSGMQRLRPLADMANDSTNLEFKVLMDDASPQTFLNREYLSHLARVGEFNIVDQLKNDDSWEHVVKRLDGTASHPALGVMNERVQQMAQFLVGTFSSQGPGAPDVKAFGTATGVVAMSEEASGRFVEAILQRALADIESRYKVLKNIAKHSLQPQIEDLKKRFGTEVVKRFLTCNLRQAVAITKKKGTDQPKSQAIALAQLQAYSEAVSQVSNHPQAASITEAIGDMIDIPITVGIGLADKEEANRRLGLMRELSQKYNEQRLSTEEQVIAAIALVAKVIHDSEFDVPEEMDMQMSPPYGGGPAATGTEIVPRAPSNITPMNPGTSGTAPPPEATLPPDAESETSPDIPSVVMMQDHPVFMDAFKDWLLTEGARCDNSVMKTAAQMMWKLHYQREILKQAELIRIEAKKQLLVKQMEVEQAQKMAPPSPEQPSPEQVAEAENRAKEEQVGAEVMTRIADDQAKDADIARQEHSKDEDLKRDMLKKDYERELERERAEEEAARESKENGTNSSPKSDSNS